MEWNLGFAEETWKQQELGATATVPEAMIFQASEHKAHLNSPQAIHGVLQGFERARPPRDSHAQSVPRKKKKKMGGNFCMQTADRVVRCMYEVKRKRFTPTDGFWHAVTVLLLDVRKLKAKFARYYLYE